MSDKFPFNFQEAIRGGGLPLSDQERFLLEFTLDVCGEPLGQVMLAGLGEEAETRSWLFTVTFDDKRGVARRREIRLQPDERDDVVTLLPRRREPLVFFALLRLLLEGPKQSSATVSYKHERVLALLGWEDTVDGRAAIDQAVESYFLLSHNWRLSEEELAERKLTSFKARGRFLTRYRTRDVETEGEVKRVANEVDFSSLFVEDLKRRTLYGINWNSVREMAREILS